MLLPLQGVYNLLIYTQGVVLGWVLAAPWLIKLADLSSGLFKVDL